MKVLIVMLIMSLSILPRDFHKNNFVFSLIEKLILDDINNLNKTLDTIEEDEINLGFFITEGYENSKSKLSLSIKNTLVNHPKVNVISENYDEYTKLLEKQIDSRYEDVRLIGQLRRTRYLFKLDFNNFYYSQNFQLKDELSGTISLELIDLSTGSILYGSYIPVNYSNKLAYKKLVYFQALIFLLGIVLSFITRKFYTIKIFIVILSLFTLLNLYYFFII